MSNDNKDGINVLVCGSKNLSDKSFVYGIMDKFYELTDGKIKQVFTSKFSGTCEFARNWVEETNEKIKILNPTIKYNPISLRDCTFDMALAEKNSSLFEQLNIPDFILQNDSFFINGKELILINKINLILAFPNPEGILGPSTYNIKRFARLAGIEDKILDCSDALRQLKELHAKAPVVTNDSVFNNRHPSRKF